MVSTCLARRPSRFSAVSLGVCRRDTSGVELAIGAGGFALTNFVFASPQKCSSFRSGLASTFLELGRRRSTYALVKEKSRVAPNHAIYVVIGTPGNIALVVLFSLSSNGPMNVSIFGSCQTKERNT